MIIELHDSRLNRMTLEEFADAHDLVMEIHYQKDVSYVENHYKAKFKNVRLINRSQQDVRVFGYGATPEEAMRTYTTVITKETILVEDSEHVSIIAVPHLIYDGKNRFDKENEMRTEIEKLKTENRELQLQVRDAKAMMEHITDALKNLRNDVKSI